MSDTLNIPDARPLSPDELSEFQAFRDHMEAVVIPQIVQRDLENRERVVESRTWVMN